MDGIVAGLVVAVAVLAQHVVSQRYRDVSRPADAGAADDGSADREPIPARSHLSA
jgi:hypothetical protein